MQSSLWFFLISSQPQSVERFYSKCVFKGFIAALANENLSWYVMVDTYTPWLLLLHSFHLGHHIITFLMFLSITSNLQAWLLGVCRLAIFRWICSTVLPTSPYRHRMVARSWTDPQSTCLPAAAVTGPHKSLLSPTGDTQCFCPSYNESPPPWWLLTVCKQWGSWRLMHYTHVCVCVYLYFTFYTCTRTHSFEQ